MGQAGKSIRASLLLTCAMALLPSLFAFGSNDALQFSTWMGREKTESIPYRLRVDGFIGGMSDDFEVDSVRLDGDSLDSSDVASFDMSAALGGVAGRVLIDERFTAALSIGFGGLFFEEDQGGGFELEGDGDGFGYTLGVGYVPWISADRQFSVGVSAEFFHILSADTTFRGGGPVTVGEFADVGDGSMSFLSASMEAGTSAILLETSAFDFSVGTYGTVGLFVSSAQAEIDDFLPGQKLEYEWSSSGPVYGRIGLQLSTTTVYFELNGSFGNRSGGCFIIGVMF